MLKINIIIITDISKLKSGQDPEGANLKLSSFSNLFQCGLE